MGVPTENFGDATRAARSGQPDLMRSGGVNDAGRRDAGSSSAAHRHRLRRRSGSPDRRRRSPWRCSTASRPGPRHEPSRSASPGRASKPRSSLTSSPASTPAAGRPATIGVPEGRRRADDAPPLAATLSQKNDDGAPRYTSNHPPAARHARQRRAHPQHAARAARRQRAHRRGRPGHRPGADCSRSTDRPPADRVEGANGSSSPPALSGGAADPADQVRRRPRRASSLPTGRRRSSPSARKWATRCRIPARASRKTSRGRPRIRWPTRTAP